MKTEDKNLIAETVKKAIAEFSDGMIIPHAWLAKELNLVEPEFCPASETREFQFHRMAMVAEFKRRMLTSERRLLDTHNGKGFLLVPPKETPEVAARNALRDYSRAKRKKRFILRHVDESKLTRQELKDLESMRRDS